MFGFLRKRLGYKIMAAMIITVLLVVVAEIYMRIYFGTKDRFEIVAMIERGVINSIYAGIRHPMAVGNAEGIKRELSDIRERTEGVEVFICDPDQEVIYSTHEDKLGTRLADSISNSATLETITETLKTGIEPFGLQKLLEDEIAGKRYFVFILPIHNEKDCYHCHGSSRKILGGIMARTEGERVYSQVAAQRNRTIMIAIFTIPLAAIFVYLMVSKLVKRPVENLAEKAKRFAEGDTSVSADVKTEDEIGILGNTFNYMVESVSAASKKLELEVTRKTTLLDERTKLIVLLERANREIRELDKLKSTFLANMSHELRTPMNAIIGYTDLLIDKVDGPINEEQEKSLTKVAANARHLLQLINDVLDISKIESGKIEIEPKELDLKWIIESVIPTFEPLIKQKGLTVTVNLDEGLPPVYGDEDKVKQIFINLLSNGVKFTQRGGVTISAKLSERGIRPGEPPIFAEICVEDTGIGIKEEDLSKIFDKFTQVDISAIRQYEGTGLGLSIARGLVALHKGMIWVTSKCGEGSRFCFILPLKKEILEKPAEPVVEPSMAEGLAEYFGKPVETFLKEPEYAGKPIRCWEYVHCGQTTCPAYGSKESRCWLILGTHCEGMKIAAYPEKVDFCRGCEIIRSLIVEPEEYKATEAVSLEKEGVVRKTVLAIDDNPEAIDIVRKYLGEDYRVIGYLSGEGVIEKAKEIKPMAITLDIMMPKKDGWQVLRELKQTPETQDIPVIVLSIIDNKRLGFSLGAAEYLVKPVERQVLLKKLRNLEKTILIKKVLVVDNEPDTVELGNVLKEAGYQITITNNSKDAIKAVKDFVPDLIVLNLTMPEVSGFDVIEYLKTEEGVKDTPLVVITHKDLTEKEIDEMNGRIQGILNRGVLVKEDLLKELKDTISKVSKAE